MKKLFNYFMVLATVAVTAVFSGCNQKPVDVEARLSSIETRLNDAVTAYDNSADIGEILKDIDSIEQTADSLKQDELKHPSRWTDAQKDRLSASTREMKVVLERMYQDLKNNPTLNGVSEQ